MGGPEMAPQTPQTLGAPRRSRGAPRPAVLDRRADRRGGPEAGRPAISSRVAWHRGASLVRADRRGGPEAGARDHSSRGVAPRRVACPGRSAGRARRRAAPRSVLAWRGTDAWLVRRIGRAAWRPGGQRSIAVRGCAMGVLVG